MNDNNKIKRFIWPAYQNKSFLYTHCDLFVWSNPESLLYACILKYIYSFRSRAYDPFSNRLFNENKTNNKYLQNALQRNIQLNFKPLISFVRCILIVGVLFPIQHYDLAARSWLDDTFHVIYNYDTI